MVERGKPELVTVKMAIQLESISSRGINFNCHIKRSYFDIIFMICHGILFYQCHHGLLTDQLYMRKTSPLHAIYTFLIFYTKPMLKQLYQGFKSYLFTLGNATVILAQTDSVQFPTLLVVFINISRIRSMINHLLNFP